MTYRIAINGYGRIGQCVLRALYENGYRAGGASVSQKAMQVVAINELSDVDTIVYLTRYDTTHGRFPLNVTRCGASVSQDNDSGFLVGEDRISVLNHERLNDLDWRAHKIDLVMECTGIFGSASDGKGHIAAGADKVLFSQPTDTDVDKLIVYGLNHDQLTSTDRIVSNASCTTNCIVPVIKCLHDAFGIEQGTLTTIHSVMNDQPTIDAYHNHDLRRTRSAMHNVVPVNTGLAKGVERLLPEMKGKFTAVAMRVPTINVSAIDLTVMVSKSTTGQEVNQVLKQAAMDRFLGVMAYTEEPVASSDFNHDPHSGIIDGSQTRVSGERLVKVLTWFDNEWAFANRMLDVARYWLDK